MYTIKRIYYSYSYSYHTKIMIVTTLYLPTNKNNYVICVHSFKLNFFKTPLTNALYVGKVYLYYETLILFSYL